MSVKSVYGTYEPKWAKVGEKVTFNCKYDCAGDETADPDCALKAEFSCENRPDGIPTFKTTYYCIRTDTTESYEDIVKDDVIILCVYVVSV